MAYIDAGRTAALQGIDPDKPARASFFLTDPRLEFDYRDTEGNKRLFARAIRGDGLGGAATCSKASPRLRRSTSIRSPRSIWTRTARGRVCLTGDAAWCASPDRAWAPPSRWWARTCWPTNSQAAVSDYAAAFEPISATAGAVCRAMSASRDRRAENRAILLGSARPAAQHRYADAAHPGGQQAGRPPVAGGRAVVRPAELLNAAAPWRPAPAAKRPAPSFASAATREMLANS